MSIINQILSHIMYNLGYLIITPKSYSFGGFYLTILGSERIADFKNKKKYIYISFLIYIKMIFLIFITKNF